MITEADSSGGSGSYSGALWDTLTGGIKLVAAGELSKRYGFSFGADGNVAVNADGVVRAAGAPANDVSTSDQIAAALKNPMVIIGVIAVIALIVVVAKN